MAQISRLKVLGLAFFLGLVLAGSAWADPRLTEALIRPEAYEGQKVQLKLTFEWSAAEGQYEFQTPRDFNLINIKFLNMDQAQETYASNSGPVSRFVLTYKLLTVKMGQGTLNSFGVLYRKPGMTKWKTIQVPTAVLDIKPPLPWKLILILLTILAMIVTPFAAWFIRAKRAQQKIEKNFQSDPKQQIYAEAATMFGGFITGYTASYLRTLLSDWSAEIMKVVMTYYDIPIGSATKTWLLKELRAKNIPAGELQEIEDFLNRLQHLKFSLGAMTSDELENLRLALLRYSRGKIIIGISGIPNA